MKAADLKALISERKRAKDERERQQCKLITDDEIFHAKIVAGLTGLLDTPQFANLVKCGKEDLFRTCKACGDVHRFAYTCNLKWCPRCNWRIGRRRAELIKAWQSRIANPKHLVLTQRNFPVLTGTRLSILTRNLAKIRRAQVFRHVKGGCCSVEVTNEDRGWHLHSHWLIDATFVDMKELAVVWGKLCGQSFGIVHYDTLTNSDYCNEVCKYVVKGSEMSDWPGERMNEFVRSIYRHRFFFTFGSLWKQQKEVRIELNAAKPPAPTCECGSSDFLYEDEITALLHQIRDRERARG